MLQVLGKFPVVQHIVFGSLLSLKPADLSKRQSLITPAQFLESEINTYGSSQSSETKSSDTNASLGSYKWETGSKLNDFG